MSSSIQRQFDQQNYLSSHRQLQEKQQSATLWGNWQKDIKRDNEKKKKKDHSYDYTPYVGPGNGETVGTIYGFSFFYLGIGSALMLNDRCIRSIGATFLASSSLLVALFQYCIIQDREIQSRAGRYLNISSSSLSTVVEKGILSKIFSFLFGAGGLFMLISNYRQGNPFRSFYLIEGSLLVQSGLFYLFGHYCKNRYEERPAIW